MARYAATRFPIHGASPRDPVVFLEAGDKVPDEILPGLDERLLIPEGAISDGPADEDLGALLAKVDDTVDGRSGWVLQVEGADRVARAEYVLGVEASRSQGQRSTLVDFCNEVLEAE